MKDDSKKAPIHTRSVVTTREVREIVKRLREGFPLRSDVTIKRLPAPPRPRPPPRGSLRVLSTWHSLTAKAVERRSPTSLT